MLKGICTPICTPFTGTNQDLDETALLKHLDRMLEAGVHIIAVCGGTGEFAFLTQADRLRIAELAAKHINGTAKLIVQVSALRTQDVIEYAKHAEGLGADAMLMLPPYFEGPDTRGVVLHYEQVGKAVKTPIMVYNIPVHTGIDITPALYKKLSAEIPSVQYIKDSTGDMIRIEQLVGLGANVFCGCDYLAPYALMASAAGCFWGGSNVTPKEAVELYKLSAAGKFNDALALWEKLRASNVFYWSHAYNPSVKAALEILGKGIGECRRPVLPLTPEEHAELKTALKRLM